jgi:hypothetical protein
LELQKLRLGIAKFSLFFSQALSLCFCVYVGAGSQNFSLWLNLCTSLMGVIIGNEMLRLLALHKFYSANSSVEDIQQVDLDQAQELLSFNRRCIGATAALNALQVMFRVVVLGCFSVRNEEFLNVTSVINEEFPKLHDWLGLISCENDCGMVTNVTNYDENLVQAQRYCVERCLISQDMYASVIGITGMLQTCAFVLARLVQYKRLR